LVSLLIEPVCPIRGSPARGGAVENINYVLLGIVIEDVTGRPLRNVFRTGVLDGPGLDGLVYPEQHALAADGWQVESVSASLARWGYELLRRLGAFRRVACRDDPLPR
jgi:CubicO group peptidase (beta-lactamase class C family)